MTTKLSPRDTAQLELLRRIRYLNSQGIRPNKHHVVVERAAGYVPSDTRARHYRRIDTLITLGLVESTPLRGHYALWVTPAGVAELEAHDV